MYLGTSLPDLGGAVNLINTRLRPGDRQQRRVSKALAVSPRSRKVVKTAGLCRWSGCPRLKPGVKENHEEFWLTTPVMAGE
jgi:hypothetical protein